MISEQELRKELRWACFEAGRQKVYAEAIGISPAVLSVFMSGNRKPSKSLLEAIGYEAVSTTLYRKKGSHK